MAKEAEAAIEAKQAQEEELGALRQQIQQMARDAETREAEDKPSKLRRQLSESGRMYETAHTMIAKVEVRMKRKKKKARSDPEAVQRILETLPVLSACNDLRALTDLEVANREIFQRMGGVGRLIDYLRPKGVNAPYATIVARTLPCVMDAAGRRLFHEYAAGVDADGEVRYRYLLALLQSLDPDDKENACLAIAACAQDSEINREAFFEHGISTQVYSVLYEQSKLQIPRQRLQRVVVMAMAELASGFEPYKEQLRKHEGVPLLLSFISPSHDEYLIKETLQLLGRMTQNSPGIQAELQKYGAIERYSQLLFAQMHDAQISELAALALVNLISEVPACLAMIEQHPKYSAIRYELLASMARALSSSMIRNESSEMSLSGSADFHFWGSAVVGHWQDGNAGGDRKHTSFVDNPQFLVKAPAGTNLCVVLQDTLEASREQDRVKQRPLFLRLCVVAATAETVASGLKQLDINSSGARPASVNEETGVVLLEPTVQAALDVSKTREVALRCHVKTAPEDGAWVIVPHVGVSHQHSRFVLAVFADREIQLCGELQSWQKRVVTAAWSPLCSAPRGIADAHWRNCPQFQLINAGSASTNVVAFLSYAERDVARNRRHTTVADPPGGMGAEERPLLSLYVMKPRVPERRYVGTLSPYVDEYVAHSVVTNSWCVCARWTLEPGDVYAVLAVMAEGTTHEVPLRLTLYSKPTEEGTVLLTPLTDASEWHLTALEGVTDGLGQTTIELMPQAADGGGGVTQANLVLEAGSADAFCSIATEHEGVQHKILSKYQQQQAVLSAPFSVGSLYKMTTRCITAQQQPLKGAPVKLLLYSTRPMQATPASGQQLHLAQDTAKRLVCKDTAAGAGSSYGEEGVPEDSRRQEGVDGKGGSEEVTHDPKVLSQVISELETQRDQLYAFSREELKGTPPLILETLRKDNEELKASKTAAERALVEAQALAHVAEGRQQSGAPPDTSQLKAQVEAARSERNAVEQRLLQSEQQLKQQQQMVESLTKQLKRAESSGEGGAAAAEATAELRAELATAQRDLYAEQARALQLEQASKAAASGEQAAAGRAPEKDTLAAELERLRQENKKLMSQSATKSSACILL